VSADLVEFTEGRITVCAPAGDPTAAPIALMLRAVLMDAQERGIVVTVEQQPLAPLAMGNHQTVATVRRKGKAHYP
jgi:hypothetical protein